MLRRKGLTIWRHFGGTEVATGAGALAECVAAYRAMKRALYRVASSAARSSLVGK